MALTFNLRLRTWEVDPAGVRLLRHDTRAVGRTAYALWRDDRAVFEGWQAIQRRDRRSYFTGTHWASFATTVDGRTVFLGLYEVDGPERPAAGARDPLRDDELDADWVDVYPYRTNVTASEYGGRLIVDWGLGTRAWAQVAANQNKRITELAAAAVDPPFPGFANVMERLSDIGSLPLAWRTPLASVGGVYVLTCPATKEHYVGAAHGNDGFLGRWWVHAATGGDAALFRTRPVQDYHVGILQVAGSDATVGDVLRLESLWKDKLLSRAMGLNAA